MSKQNPKPSIAIIMTCEPSRRVAKHHEVRIEACAVVSWNMYTIDDIDRRLEEGTGRPELVA
jgi:hypothetical protein